LRPLLAGVIRNLASPMPASWNQIASWLRQKDLATTSGRAPADIVEDALAGYLEEVVSVRKALDSRYDDLENGRVKPIDGEEAFRKLREKSERRRSADD